MRLTPELARALERLAANAGLTPEAWIRSAIVAHGGKLAPGRCTLRSSDGRNCKLPDGHLPPCLGYYSEAKNAPQSPIPHGTLLGSTDIDSD